MCRVTAKTDDLETHQIQFFRSVATCDGLELHKAAAIAAVQDAYWVTAPWVTAPWACRLACTLVTLSPPTLTLYTGLRPT